MATLGAGDSPGVSVIAVSGPDNVGKTTQLRILSRRLGRSAALAGSLDSYDLRWRAIRTGGMADWWFERARVEQVADVLACSYLERARAVSGSGLWNPRSARATRPTSVTCTSRSGG